MDKISVIMPVYNVSQYLDKAVESVCGQTHENWELLLVDDGSTDASPQMCDVWMQKDSRIHVIHKENGGVSSARNAGLDAAQGEYIFFLDSDDYIHPKTLEILLCLAEQYDADIALGFTRGTEKRDYEEPDREDYCIQTASGKEVVQYWMEPESAMRFFGYSSSGVWSKLFKRDLFATLRFDIEALVGEDTEILPFLFDCARLVVSTDQRLYYLYHRAGSLTRSEITIEFVEKLCRTLCRMYKGRLDYFRAKRQNGYENILRTTYQIALNDLVEKREKYKKYKPCRTILRTGLRDILRALRKDKIHSTVYLFRYYIFLKFPFLYSIIYKLTAEK